MILVDDRAGSSDLYPFIKSLTPDVCMTRLEFGDIAWTGSGPDDTNINVGVEHKDINDVLTVMLDGRFAAHQLPGLIDSYDRIWLMVEGSYRPDPKSGTLQSRRKGQWVDVRRNGNFMMYRDLLHWFMTLEMQAGVRVVRTFDSKESARWLVAAHSWFVNKGWDEHKTLKQFHVPNPPVAALAKPNVVRRVAKELSAVGWERSGPIAAHFGTVARMINAPAEEWASIVVGTNKIGVTHTVGKNRAVKIVNEINGKGAFE